jgi:hypothetical protein
MPGGDRIGVFVTRVVEMDDLLQALKVAVVREFLLKIGTGRFGGWAL